MHSSVHRSSIAGFRAKQSVCANQQASKHGHAFYHSNRLSSAPVPKSNHASIHGVRGGVAPIRVTDTGTEIETLPSSSEGQPASAPIVKGKQNGSGRRAIMKASKTGAQIVVEKEKALADYMALPASQYSVLDGRKIERVDDSTFRCYVGQLKLFQWSVEPVLMLSVDAEPELGGCTIKMLSCELEGPAKLVDDINAKIKTQMTNEVRWRYAGGASETSGINSETSDSNDKEIVSTTSLMVDIEIPSWCSFIPTERVETVGSGVLQTVLNTMVPRFLKHLNQDYAAWASGDSSRKPVEN